MAERILRNDRELEKVALNAFELGVRASNTNEVENIRKKLKTFFRGEMLPSSEDCEFCRWR